MPEDILEQIPAVLNHVARDLACRCYKNLRGRQKDTRQHTRSMLRWLDQEEIISERQNDSEEEKKLTEMNGLEGQVVDHQRSKLCKVH